MSLNLYSNQGIYDRQDKTVFVLDFIKVKNFGCFDEECHMDFGKLNVIAGPNNSGKSTIFKALNLFRICQQTPKDKISWNSDYYSLMGFDSTAYDSSKKFSITVGSDKNSMTLDIYKDNTKWNDGKITDTLSIQEEVELSNVTYISTLRKGIDYQNHVGSNYQTQTHNTMFKDEIQDMYPDGRNVIRFLVEKSTSQDPSMELFNEWLRKIDPNTKSFKTPVVKHDSSLSTDRNDGRNTKTINMHFQGDGIQNAITIIAAVIFSPKNSTIVIEEPELHQHSNSIDTLVDLFNYAVNELDKQIIIVTHSFEIINAYCSDIGEGSSRGSDHVKANPDDFKLVVVNKALGDEKIKEYDLAGKKYADVRGDFKVLLG